MLEKCATALISPMKRRGALDRAGLKQLLEFQRENRVSGLVAVGTTGESPTLTGKEWRVVIDCTVDSASSRCEVVAGTGGNCTREALAEAKEAMVLGVDGLLLVDPYYNGPSSLEIRREYLSPVAARFPDLDIIPYIIPGRTGTQLLPQDLAILHQEHRNVRLVKEATGDKKNQQLTRKLCGKGFGILSGDDDGTFGMMTDPRISATGVISVASNVAPRAVQSMTEAILEGERSRAASLARDLKPLFGMITLRTTESSPFGDVLYRARNPLPTKTLMKILGMPSGPCRAPLGRLTRGALKTVLGAARKLYTMSPEILKPVEGFFDVSLEERLWDGRIWKGLCYDGY